MKSHVRSGTEARLSAPSLLTLPDACEEPQDPHGAGRTPRHPVRARACRLPPLIACTQHGALPATAPLPRPPALHGAHAEPAHPPASLPAERLLGGLRVPSMGPREGKKVSSEHLLSH